MNIAALVCRVRELYDDVDVRFSLFRRTTGIDCPSACGLCCMYPRVEATVLEFLPLAKKLWDNGSAFDVYRSIDPGETICVFHGRAEGQTRGMCTEYAHRGFICRTFGYQLVRRESGPKLGSCRILEQTHAERIAALTAADLIRFLPFVQDLREQLRRIAPALADEKMPVNKVIRRAIEVVFESGYRPVMGGGLKKAA